MFVCFLLLSCLRCANAQITARALESAAEAERRVLTLEGERAVSSKGHQALAKFSELQLQQYRQRRAMLADILQRSGEETVVKNAVSPQLDTTPTAAALAMGVE